MAILKQTFFANETDKTIEVNYSPDYSYDPCHKHMKPSCITWVSWTDFDIADTLLPSFHLEGVNLDKYISLSDLYENKVIITFRGVDNSYSFRTISDMDCKRSSDKDAKNLKYFMDLEKTGRLEPLLIKETRRPVVEVLSRLEVLLKNVKIWHSQCEHLVKKFRSGAHELVRLSDIYDGKVRSHSQFWTPLPCLMKFIWSKFTSSMLEGEALLLLCSRVDNYSMAAFALSSPRSSSVATFSQFAMVLRELDWTLDFLWFFWHPRVAYDFRSFNGWSWCKDSLRLIYPRFGGNADGVTTLGDLEADRSRQTAGRKAFETSLALEPNNNSLASAISISFFLPTSYKLTARNRKENRDKLKAIWKKRLEFEPAPSPESTSGSNAEDILHCFGIGYPDTTNVGELGSGSFKKVSKCKWLGETVAVSVFDGVSEDAIKAEASLLARVQHPNVVGFFGYAYKTDDHRPEAFLVTELMEQDLDKLIIAKLKSHGGSVKITPPFVFSVALDISLQIVEAMIHLHKCGVMHRDLKPGNCMTRLKYRNFTCNDVPEYYTVKLIDFGESKLRGEDSNFQTRRKGTPYFMAPEVWAGIPYTWSADVYSFGVTCYEIFTGRLPFKRGIKFEEVQKIMRENPSFPFELPSPLQELIKKCWAQNALDRPSFQDIREALWRLKFYAYWSECFA